MSAAPRRYLIVAPRPFPLARFFLRRRYLIVVPRPLPAAGARYAAQVLDRGATASARDSATLLQQEKIKSISIYL
jgi:hypothetical protein